MKQQRLSPQQDLDNSNFQSSGMSPAFSMGNQYRQQLLANASTAPAASTEITKPRLGVWTTGRRGGYGGVTSEELPRSGNWDSDDFLNHHSDRSNSWAANNIRNGANQDLQAYDFTFEKLDSNGAPIPGTAQGLELTVPSDSKVLDIQHTYQGSGGYGKFIALEDIVTGARVSIHHLDSVGDFRKGQILKGGTVFGTQGASGNGRYDFATHIDIVGTEEAVSAFIRSNQEGNFKTRNEEVKG